MMNRRASVLLLLTGLMLVPAFGAQVPRRYHRTASNPPVIHGNEE